ncbi:MAG TPA: hypothetical protein VG053_06055 [Solirubrobacteraceae bacterium]|jgi:hypothetical protein|nr:hypothetical protein [Solirubrobacteraceae bacterium]
MSPIVSPRSRESSRRPVLRVLGPSERREPPADGREATEPRRPTLRIVPDGGRELAARVAPVLLAGADAGGRAVLRAELDATLPPRTRWVEADDVAGVLERAAYSRMVVLAGDLDDADAESLIRLLGRRHPELPVIRVDAPLPAAAGGHG